MMSTMRPDAEVVDAVKEAFNRSLMIPHDGISITASNGTVWLEGAVDWEFERIAAVDRALGVPGVGAVYNHLSVINHARVAEPPARQEAERELVAMA